MTELPPAQAEFFLKELLARIHGDGGHYVVRHGITKACNEADRIVCQLQAESGPKCVLGKPCRLHGFVHGAEAEELRSKLTEYAEDIQDKHKLRGETVAEEIVALLEEIDARDSVAFLETAAGQANAIESRLKSDFSDEEMDDG